MLVTGGATAEQPERFASNIPEFMLFARRNVNSVPCSNFGQFALYAHSSLPMRDEINFLGSGVIMFLGAAAYRKARFRQALIANVRIPVSQNFTDFRPIFGHKRGHLIQVPDFHVAQGRWLPGNELRERQNSNGGWANSRSPIILRDHSVPGRGLVFLVWTRAVCRNGQPTFQ